MIICKRLKAKTKTANKLTWLLYIWDVDLSCLMNSIITYRRIFIPIPFRSAMILKTRENFKNWACKTYIWKSVKLQWQRWRHCLLWKQNLFNENNLLWSISYLYCTDILIYYCYLYDQNEGVPNILIT